MAKHKWEEFHKKNEALAALNRLVFHLERLAHWQAQADSEEKTRAIAANQAKKDELLEKNPNWKNQSLEQLKQALPELRQQTGQTIEVASETSVGKVLKTYQEVFAGKPGYGEVKVSGNLISFRLNGEDFKTLVEKCAEQKLDFKAIDNIQDPPVEYRAKAGKLMRRIGTNDWEAIGKNASEEMRERVQSSRREHEVDGQQEEDVEEQYNHPYHR